MYDIICIIQYIIYHLSITGKVRSVSVGVRIGVSHGVLHVCMYILLYVMKCRIQLLIQPWL